MGVYAFMKKFLCLSVLALAAVIALQACVALENTNSSDAESAESESYTTSDKEQSIYSPSSESLTSDDGESSAPLHSQEASASSAESSQTADESSGDGYAIDIEPYLEYINTSDLLLVNKQIKLAPNYVPENLTDITYTRTDRKKERMVDYAEKALCAFLEEAYSYGYTDVTVTSGYRSYGTQDWLFNYYVENEMKSGKNREQAEIAAASYSARPGTSEHQSGLCVDMHNLPAADQAFGKTEAGRWMAANAHRFGFILRFPQGKEEITGYSYEPWHFRFVGLQHAEKIYKENLCLEEYMDKYYPELVKEN